MNQSRAWLITINNYTFEHEQSVMGLTGTKYIVYGRETAPTTGMPHIHIFVLFNTPRRWNTVKNIFPMGEVKPVESGNAAAVAYCKKGGDFWQSGEPPKARGESEKDRWKEAIEAAKTGDWGEIPPDIYIRYFGNLKKIYAESQRTPDPLDDLDFHWYYGDTGTGKSRTAREQNPGYYLKGINKWWDGYDGQECVIIEEWSPMDMGAERIMGHYLKQWCDHHPFQGETKGGMKMFRPPKIIVTSNWRLEDCFHDPQIVEPLKRRMQIHHFSNWPPRAGEPAPACSPTCAQDPHSPSLSQLWL